MARSALTISYRKQGTVPPIFVAGSFTSPPWEPYELEQDGGKDSGSFSKTFSVDPGTYQYKFRLGTGDWWAVDESQETATDNQGNINNVLTVQEPRPISGAPAAELAQPRKTTETRIDLGDNNPVVGNLEQDPAAPEPEFSERAENGQDTSLSQMICAVATQAAPERSVSHDLPTPPISEKDDGLDSMDTWETAEGISDGSGSLIQTSERSHEEKSSTGLSSMWSRSGVILLALAVTVVPVMAWSLSQ